MIPDTKCNDTTTIPLVHVIASKEDAPNDAVHYIVCTLDRPTITIKHVLKKTKVTFNKTNLCNQSGEAFSFDQGGTSDLSGIIITKLYAYNDLKDTVVPDAGTQIDNDIMGDFKWQMDDSSDGKEMKFKGINAHSSITLIVSWVMLYDLFFICFIQKACSNDVFFSSRYFFNLLMISIHFLFI